MVLVNIDVIEGELDVVVVNVVAVDVVMQEVDLVLVVDVVVIVVDVVIVVIVVMILEYGLLPCQMWLCNCLQNKLVQHSYSYFYRDFRYFLFR